MGSKGKEEGRSEGRSTDISTSPKNSLARAEQDGHSPELLLSTGGKGCVPTVRYTNTMPTTQFPGPNQGGSKEKPPNYLPDSVKMD